MTKQSEQIRRFILENVQKNPYDISRKAAEHFNITRQAINKYLQKLVFEKLLTEEGTTKGKFYKLSILFKWEKEFSLKNNLEEDVVWTREVLPLLGPLPKNVSEIWNYGFTEIFNNAIDHSGGGKIKVSLIKTAINTEISIEDNGIGIFKKIQSSLNLLDERHAILELSKGKLTTDPKRHTGEGIFFSSRVFDHFMIASGLVNFSHSYGDHEDFLIERHEEIKGTLVFMEMNNHAERELLKVFQEYQSNDDEFKFNKTVVPVRLAQYGEENLISRSQAKRLLARIELFQIIIFDFSGVEMIGQAFADEIFRVFAQNHPRIEMQSIHTNEIIQKMINRAST